MWKAQNTLLASHFAAVIQVQTPAVVHSSPGEDQELKIDTCALGSGSSRSSESEPKKDTSTTTAHSTELPTTEATTSRGGVELMYSGSARRHDWTLPEEEDPSGEETGVNEKDEQAMTRGGVEPMYSGSAPKCEWTETLPEEEDPSCEETSDDEDKEATTSGEDPSSEEDEEATTSGGVKLIFSGTGPKSYWTQILPAKEEDASGAETSVNEEDEKGRFRLVRRIYPSELKMVRKIAQGGQAKIFLAKYLKTQQDVVVKRYTSCQVQAGELQRQMERVMKACEKRDKSGLCRGIGVSVDEKGRVSTIMELMAGDLRNFIDHRNWFDRRGLMKAISSTRLGRMKQIASDRLILMKQIANGVKELHGCGFIHKDLKASNILLKSKLNLSRRNRKYSYYLDWRQVHVKIGDYESSDVVMGTGFFRAPEVLRPLRDGTNVECSAAVDVYGFGMVCYELLTGKLPFQGHPLSDYDLVLSGKRPDVSDEPPWMRELLHRCWDEDPHKRPGWDEILQILGEELLLSKESYWSRLLEGERRE
jgi:tRNA A-37 threonylcarbamoyl transferase component Bud32